jgi:hypothetical protein
MTPSLMIGITIVFFALASYTIAIISEIKNHRPNFQLRIFLTVGIILDISATTFMILGSRNFPFTFHGILGYSALLMMAIDTILMWRRFHSHPEERLPPPLHRYSLVAYSWWVCAFLAGIIITLIPN